MGHALPISALALQLMTGGEGRGNEVLLPRTDAPDAIATAAAAAAAAAGEEEAAGPVYGAFYHDAEAQKKWGSGAVSLAALRREGGAATAAAAAAAAAAAPVSMGGVGVCASIKWRLCTALSGKVAFAAAQEEGEGEGSEGGESAYSTSDDDEEEEEEGGWFTGSPTEGEEGAPSRRAGGRSRGRAPRQSAPLDRDGFSARFPGQSLMRLLVARVPRGQAGASAAADARLAALLERCAASSEAAPRKGKGSKHRTGAGGGGGEGNAAAPSAEELFSALLGPPIGTQGLQDESTQRGGPPPPPLLLAVPSGFQLVLNARTQQVSANLLAPTLLWHAPNTQALALLAFARGVQVSLVWRVRAGGGATVASVTLDPLGRPVCISGTRLTLAQLREVGALRACVSAALGVGAGGLFAARAEGGRRGGARQGAGAGAGSGAAGTREKKSGGEMSGVDGLALQGRFLQLLGLAEEARSAGLSGAGAEAFAGGDFSTSHAATVMLQDFVPGASAAAAAAAAAGAPVVASALAPLLAPYLVVSPQALTQEESANFGCPAAGGRGGRGSGWG